jgi:hypothetical protein
MVAPLVGVGAHTQLGVRIVDNRRDVITDAARSLIVTSARLSDASAKLRSKKTWQQLWDRPSGHESPNQGTRHFQSFHRQYTRCTADMSPTSGVDLRVQS